MMSPSDEEEIPEVSLGKQPVVVVEGVVLSAHADVVVVLDLSPHVVVID